MYPTALYRMPFPRFQFEELNCFKLDENPATVLKKVRFQNNVKIIVGTQTGKVVMYTPSNLQTLLISVFQRPVLNIFVDESGASGFFFVTDGRQWKAIDYATSQFVDVEIPNGTFGVGWARDQYVICQVDGISLKPMQSYFTSIFKKKQEANYIYKGKIQLFSQFGKDVCWFLDAEDNLRAINTLTQQPMVFRSISKASATPIESVQRPCKCGCFPNVISLNGAAVISWHNIILVYSCFGGDNAQGLLGRIVTHRMQTNAEQNEMLPICCICIRDKLINSAVIFDNYIYCLVEGYEYALQIYNVSGKLLQEMKLNGQLVAMDLVFAHRVFSYIPNSQHRPENFQLIILEYSKIIFAQFQVELDSIMSDVNEVYLMCEQYKERPFDSYKFSQFVKQLTKRLITYSSQNQLPEFLDVPDNFISLFLKMFLIEDAHYVLSELISYTNDKYKYLNTYLSQFANAGVLSMLLPFVPDPESPKPLSNEIYQQILQSLLLNDYKSFYDILKPYYPVYDADQLILNIKNSLLIANQAFNNDKMNPQWLRKSLIYLYMKQDKPNMAFEYVIDVHDVNYCVKFCIENNLYKQLLLNFRKFRTDDVVGIIYQVMLKNIRNQYIIIQSLHTVLNVYQVYSNPYKLLTSYLRQTYGTEQMERIQEIGSDQQLRNLTELLSLLYQNILLIEESNSIRQLLFELRHYYILLQQIFAQSTLSLVFLQVTLLCCITAHKDYQGCEYLDTITAFLASLSCDMPVQYRGILLMLQKYKVVKQYDQPFINLQFLGTISDCSVLQALSAIINIQSDEDLLRACRHMKNSASPIYAAVFVLNASFSLKYPISPEILREALAPLLKNNSANISPSLQALAGPMRQILPLDDLLMTSAGLDILYETQKEALFTRSCLEVVGADYFTQQLKRERAAKRGIAPTGSCVFCGEACDDYPFFVMFCGHIAHEGCTMKQLKAKGWTGMQACICCECNKEDQFAYAVKTGDKWFSILE